MDNARVANSMDNACVANRRIIGDARDEAANENEDRVWRRWLTFCGSSGIGDDPFITALSRQEQQLVIKSFLSLYRTALWDVSGGLKGIRVTPVVNSTVRDAASSLAAAFQNNHKLSPFHEQGSTNLLPVIRSLLKAYDNVDPPTNQQKAITPKLLRCLHSSTGIDTLQLRDTLPAATADLTISAFFFAMRSCEFSTTQKPGPNKDSHHPVRPLP
jgi:hypothetical protein